MDPDPDADLRALYIALNADREDASLDHGHGTDFIQDLPPILFNRDEPASAPQPLSPYLTHVTQPVQQQQADLSVSLAGFQSLQQQQQQQEPQLASFLHGTPQQDQQHQHQLLQHRVQGQQQPPPPVVPHTGPVRPTVNLCPTRGGESALERLRMSQLKGIADKILALAGPQAEGVNDAAEGRHADTKRLDPDLSCHAPELWDEKCWFLAGTGMRGLNWNPGGTSAFRAAPIPGTDNQFYALKRSGKQTFDSLGQKKKRIISHWVVGVRHQLQLPKQVKTEDSVAEAFSLPSIQEAASSSSSRGRQLGGPAADEPCMLPPEILSLLTELKSEKYVKDKEAWTYKTFPEVSYWQCDEVEDESLKRARSASGELGGSLTAPLSAGPASIMTTAHSAPPAWSLRSPTQQQQEPTAGASMQLAVVAHGAPPVWSLQFPTQQQLQQQELTAGPSMQLAVVAPSAPPAWSLTSPTQQQQQEPTARAYQPDSSAVSYEAAAWTSRPLPYMPPRPEDELAYALIDAIHGPGHPLAPQLLQTQPGQSHAAAAGQQLQPTTAEKLEVYIKASDHFRQLLHSRECDEECLCNLKLPERPPSLPQTPRPAAGVAAGAAESEVATGVFMHDEGAAGLGILRQAGMPVESVAPSLAAPLGQQASASGQDSDSSGSKSYSPPFLHWLLVPKKGQLWDLDNESGPALDPKLQILLLDVVRDHVESAALDRLLCQRDSFAASGLNRACAVAEPLLVHWLLGDPLRNGLPAGGGGQPGRPPSMALAGLPNPHKPSRELLLAFSKSGWLALHEACRNGHVDNAIAFIRALEIEFEGDMMRYRVQDVLYSLKHNKFFKKKGGEEVLKKACDTLGYSVRPAPNGWSDKERLVRMLKGLAIRS